MEFLQAAEKLKDTLRSGRTSNGRTESVAEHSWRLCLFAMLVGRELENIDVLRVLMLCVVHDLGEALGGDVPATEQVAGDDRASRDWSDLLQICMPLPSDQRESLIALYDEYSAARTPEAVVAKGLDKLETMSQHLLGNDHPGFDYEFNLTYGRRWTDADPLLRQLRSLVDAQTEHRIASRTAAA